MTEAADKGGAADRAEPGDHRAPGHEKNPQRPRSAIGPYAQVIDEWLLADRNAAQARHAARRIWGTGESMATEESTTNRYELMRWEIMKAALKVFEQNSVASVTLSQVGRELNLIKAEFQLIEGCVGCEIGRPESLD